MTLLEGAEDHSMFKRLSVSELLIYAGPVALAVTLIAIALGGGAESYNLWAARIK
jgi:hypothetical protein